jgi:hypothetical protein
MDLREHAIFFWGLITRWPHATAVVIGAFAAAYAVYYSVVEGLPVEDDLLAAVAMVLLCVVLKTTHLFVFYRFYHSEEFKGSFLILAFLASLPLVAALAIAMLFAQHQFEAPPPGVIPYILGGAILFFSLAFGAAARVIYWIGSGGLKWR